MIDSKKFELTIVADELHARWQRLDHFLVEPPSEVDTFECSIYHQGVVECACLTLLEKFVAVFGSCFDNFGER